MDLSKLMTACKNLTSDKVTERKVSFLSCYCLNCSLLLAACGAIVILKENDLGKQGLNFG